MSDLPNWLGVLPLGALIVLAAVMVRQGRRKPHDRGNIRGGGPGADTSILNTGGRRRGDHDGFGSDGGDGGGGD